MSPPPAKAPESATEHAPKTEETPVTLAEAAAATAGTGPLKVIIVRALADGFRRAGRGWTREPTRVAYDALSAEQIAALQAEPMLNVQIVEE